MGDSEQELTRDIVDMMDIWSQKDRVICSFTEAQMVMEFLMLHETDFIHICINNNTFCIRRR